MGWFVYYRSVLDAGVGRDADGGQCATRSSKSCVPAGTPYSLVGPTLIICSEISRDSETVKTMIGLLSFSNDYVFRDLRLLAKIIGSGVQIECDMVSSLRG